eukprot:5299751-Pleurochrysis_carterae.AAC.1
MYKELKDELNNLHDAHEADKHEQAIERMRDELLLDNCSDQDFADKANTLIRDYNPYISVPHARERLGRLIIKFLPAALAGEGRALLRDLFDKNALGKESCVIDEAMRLVKNGAHRDTGFSSLQRASKEGQQGGRSGSIRPQRRQRARRSSE